MKKKKKKGPPLSPSFFAAAFFFESAIEEFTDPLQSLLLDFQTLSEKFTQQ